MWTISERKNHGHNIPKFKEICQNTTRALVNERIATWQCRIYYQIPITMHNIVSNKNHVVPYDGWDNKNWLNKADSDSKCTSNHNFKP